jgi:hypothetical protein
MLCYVSGAGYYEGRISGLCRSLRRRKPLLRVTCTPNFIENDVRGSGRHHWEESRTTEEWCHDYFLRGNRSVAPPKSFRDKSSEEIFALPNKQNLLFMNITGPTTDSYGIDVSKEDRCLSGHALPVHDESSSILAYVSVSLMARHQYC